MEKKTARDILSKYTAGQATLEETNAALKAAGMGFHLDPTRSTFTGEELLNTKAETAETASGWGLLDTGTGSLDKVEVRDGKLVADDCGEMYALCLIGGKVFHVKGTELVE